MQSSSSRQRYSLCIFCFAILASVAPCFAHDISFGKYFCHFETRSPVFQSVTAVSAEVVRRTVYRKRASSSGALIRDDDEEDLASAVRTATLAKGGNDDTITLLNQSDWASSRTMGAERTDAFSVGKTGQFFSLAGGFRSP